VGQQQHIGPEEDVNVPPRGATSAELNGEASRITETDWNGVLGRYAGRRPAPLLISL
jgi:hypothetical protein